MLRLNAELGRLSASRMHPRFRRPHSFPSRHFHASRPNQLLAESLQVSHDAFQAIHTVTGLPWSASILLSAALFRLSWLPVQYYIQSKSGNQAVYAPLLLAWRKAYQHQARRKYPGGTETDARLAEMWVRKELSLKNVALRQKYGGLGFGTSIALQLSFLPVWILNADVIRRMSGLDHSFLGLWTGNEAVNPIPAEQDFLHEGFAWVSTLTAADPFWLLPLTFGALLAANLSSAGGANLGERLKKNRLRKPGLAKAREHMFLTVLQALAIGCVAFPVILIRNETPTAVVLYMIGSAATQFLQRKLLISVIGTPKNIKPAVAKPAAFKEITEAWRRERVGQGR